MMAYGSAVASLVTQSVTAVAYLALVQHLFRFRLNFRYLATLLIFTLAVILIAWLSRRLEMSWLYSLSVMVAGSVIIAFSIRLIKLKSMYLIIKNREE